jgi:hypothetical protein
LDDLMTFAPGTILMGSTAHPARQIAKTSMMDSFLIILIILF